MNENLTSLRALITLQQKGHSEGEPEFNIGEQLYDIAEREPASAELILQDLQIPAMSLKKVAEVLKAYSDKNRGKAQCFCITPKTAEKLLREFYGLRTDVKSEKPDTKKAEKPDEGYIDLSAFLD